MPQSLQPELGRHRGSVRDSFGLLARRRMGARSVGREYEASAGRPQEDQASVFSPSNSARLIAS